MNYLRHPAWLWLEKHDKDKIQKSDDNTQAMFANGTQFEHYAEIQFEGATRMHWDKTDYDSYLTVGPRTKEAIERGSKVILQAKFETDELACICDVVRIVDGHTVDLIEIKSSTSVKKEHLYDLAFQTEVLHRNGYKVRDVSVIYVDRDFVAGSIGHEMTIKENVTTKVLSIGEETKRNIDAALAVMRSSSIPDISPRHVGLGAMSEWLAIYRNLVELPEYSIYDLVKLTPLQIEQFEDDGILHIADIPEGTYLTPKQELQVLATKQEKPIINRDAIRAFLGELTFPLYFLDYETFSGVVPYFDGQSPYQQIPFQVSVHRLDSIDDEPLHDWYLHREKSDPIVRMTESLDMVLGTRGSIITWNMSFEKNCNKLMGQLYPEYQEFYEMINDRIVDLGTPFKDDMYVDKAFRGSWSIKNVMPVLVPELSYKTLGIQNGSTAQQRWIQAVLEESRDDKEQVFDDLLKYCELDTLAMVEIFNVLWQRFIPMNPEPDMLDMTNEVSKRGVKCMWCGSTRTAKIEWGMYDDDALEDEDVKSGKVYLGGCSPEMVAMRTAIRHCYGCGKNY
jgi:hypothetical protein